MTKHVLVPLAQGIEEMEAITIIDVLRRAGALVTAASVDEINIKASRGTRLLADCLIGDCMDKSWDLIVLPGGIPGIVQETGHAPQILSGRPHGQNSRPLGGLAPVCAGRLQPVAVNLLPGNISPDPLLAFPGVSTPQCQLAAVSDFHFSVSDIEPDRLVRLALDHNAVPAGIFEHG